MQCWKFPDKNSLQHEFDKSNTEQAVYKMMKHLSFHGQRVIIPNSKLQIILQLTKKILDNFALLSIAPEKIEKKVKDIIGAYNESVNTDKRVSLENVYVPYWEILTCIYLRRPN